MREELLPLRLHVNGPDHVDTIWAMHDLSASYHVEGRFAEAEPLCREFLQRLTTRYPSTNDTVASARCDLAGLLQDWAWSERGAAEKSKAVQRVREAESLLRDCLDTRVVTLGPGSPRVAETRSRLGDALAAIAVHDGMLSADVRLVQLTCAESLLLEGHETLRQNESVAQNTKRDALKRLVRLYEAWDKPEQLAEWRKKLAAFDKAGLDK